MLPSFQWIGMILIILSPFRLPSTAVSIDQNTATVQFPESIIFRLHASSDTVIESVTLEYGTDALACGESASRAVPEDFEPTNEVEVEWTWNLRRAGTLPPGTVVWWRWILQDDAGVITTTEQQSLVFIDDQFSWQSLTSGNLTLLWYAGSSDFASQLLEAGVDALTLLEDMTGVAMERPVQVYIYASSEEMQAATLFSPDWGGGRAFPRFGKIIIGVSPSILSWGMDTMAHELSHVVIGDYTFSCVDRTPIWVDEGLATYIEGELEPYMASLLEEAIQQDTLLSTKEVGEIFSSDPDLARLAYAQSFSLVQFLLETRDPGLMLDLLSTFKEGYSEDKALEEVYGISLDGLEIAWREWLGAEPMEGSASVDAEPTATLYPTLAPITGPVTESTITPTVAPDQRETDLSQDDQVNAPAGSSIGSTMTILLVTGIIVILVVVVGFVFRRSRSTRETGQDKTHNE